MVSCRASELFEDMGRSSSVIRTMQIIICALYNEAAPIVKALGLKAHEGEVGRFRLFHGTGFLVGISGVGATNSAILTTILLERYKRMVRSIVNLGVCGLTGQGEEMISIGELVLCNGVYSSIEERAYHPEILFEHHFKEARLVTWHRPVARGEQEAFWERFSGFDLVDMEAHGFMKAAEPFLPPSSTHVFKIPSDPLEPSSVTQEQIRELVVANVDNILRLLEAIRDMDVHEGEEAARPWPMIEEILGDPRLSHSMRHSLKALLVYGRLNKGAGHVIRKWWRHVHREAGKGDFKRRIRDLKGHLQGIPLCLGEGKMGGDAH